MSADVFDWENTGEHSECDHKHGECHVTDDEPKTEPECACTMTPESTWLSAASCGYGSGYEPGSQWEWNPECPAHPPHVPECTCAMTESSMLTCPKHGEAKWVEDPSPW